MQRLIYLLLFSWAQVHAQIEVELSQPTKPYTLEVSLFAGDIHLTKHAGKNVRVEVIKHNPAPPAPPKEGMRRISPDDEHLSIVEKNNHIIIDQGSSLKPSKIVIHAPNEGHFLLKTVHNGNIVVENISGDFELTNVNGKIIMNNVSGSAVASTINGKIHATFLQVKQGTPMAFSTLNGNIDLSFPATIKANLKARSDHGNIYSDFTLKNESTLSKTQEKGMTRLETSKWVTATINQGGPEMMLKTVNGNIYIKRNK